MGPFPVHKAQQDSTLVSPMLKAMENFVPMYDLRGKMLWLILHYDWDANIIIGNVIGYHQQEQLAAPDVVTVERVEPTVVPRNGASANY